MSHGLLVEVRSPAGEPICFSRTSRARQDRQGIVSDVLIGVRLFGRSAPRLIRTVEDNQGART